LPIVERLADRHRARRIPLVLPVGFVCDLGPDRAEERDTSPDAEYEQHRQHDEDVADGVLFLGGGGACHWGC